MQPHTHLVDFVEHHHAAACAGLFDGLDDVAGQGANVGAPMAADFSLVVHATERYPDKFTPQGLGDGLAQ